MKRVLLILAALMFVPVSLAERIPDRTWENAVEKLRHKLQFQTSTGDWVIVETPRKRVFRRVRPTDEDTSYSRFAYRTRVTGRLFPGMVRTPWGTDYDDTDDQPVTLNWRSPNLTQRKQWTHFTLEESDSVVLFDFVKLEETDAFLERLTRHGSLNSVVTVSKSGRTTQATFSLDGAPSAETVKSMWSGTDTGTDTRSDTDAVRHNTLLPRLRGRRRLVCAVGAHQCLRYHFCFGHCKCL